MMLSLELQSLFSTWFRITYILSGFKNFSKLKSSEIPFASGVAVSIIT